MNKIVHFSTKNNGKWCTFDTRVMKILLLTSSSLDVSSSENSPSLNLCRIASSSSDSLSISDNKDCSGDSSPAIDSSG